MAATATKSTGWIFVQFDPGVEYRSSPINPDIVQRRTRARYTRYMLHFGPINFTSEEGIIADGNTLTSYNGTASGQPGSIKYICTENVLDQEGGQGSEMWKETQVWEAYSDWYDWTTIEADLGTSNPFT